MQVVRLWQELGFVIIYITARPDMQKESVLQWLGTHNFPHGIVAFSDGITPTDLLKHKMEYLIRLTKEVRVGCHGDRTVLVTRGLRRVGCHGDHPVLVTV